MEELLLSRSGRLRLLLDKAVRAVSEESTGDGAESDDKAGGQGSSTPQSGEFEDTGGSAARSTHASADTCHGGDFGFFFSCLGHCARDPLRFRGSNLNYIANAGEDQINLR